MMQVSEAFRTTVSVETKPLPYSFSQAASLLFESVVYGT